MMNRYKFQYSIMLYLYCEIVVFLLVFTLRFQTEVWKNFI